MLVVFGVRIGPNTNSAVGVEHQDLLARQIEELQAQQTERGLVLTLSDVLFDVDKASLKPGGTRAVDQLVTFLSEYPERNVLIEGFTDSTGPAELNRRLSEQRARAVRDALVARGNLLRLHEKWSEAAEAYTVALDKLGSPEPQHWTIVYFRAISNERRVDVALAHRRLSTRCPVIQMSRLRSSTPPRMSSSSRRGSAGPRTPTRPETLACGAAIAGTSGSRRAPNACCARATRW